MSGRAAHRGPARRVLIVAPHFPPSNLAGVHRSRLFAQHLPELGWEPVIVAVDPAFYEEALDPDLVRLLPRGLRVERVRALPTWPVRLVGDVGIRGFVPMLRRLLRLIDAEGGADFLLIPIPSNYAALLGPLVRRLRGVPYGIDYIDPWLFAPTGREDAKGRASLVLAGLLEPLALADASLVTGVAEGYYAGVLARNPELASRAVTAAMPYGGEVRDHEMVRELAIPAPLFSGSSPKLRLVYAGAFLPFALQPLEAMCRAIAARRAELDGLEIHFVGTGSGATGSPDHVVRPVAERFGVYGTVIHEHPRRLPYLQVLAQLEAADGVFVLGSTEPHYSPSKVYQGILSGKPVLAVLRRESSACGVLRASGAGLVLDFVDPLEVERRFADLVADFRAFTARFSPGQVARDVVDAFSARRSAELLAAAMDAALEREGRGSA